MKLYSCRFAPNGETPLHAVRVAQYVVDRGESVLEVFAPQAFAGTRASEVPVVLDHDESRRAGTVRVMAAHGDWHVADFVLDGPYAARAAEYIERSGKVSPGLTALHKDPVYIQPPCPMAWYLRARLNEISILPPGSIAWYVGAKVTGSTELPSSPPTPTERPAPPPTLVRDYRPPDAAAARYAEERARKGILVRFGTGEILGVR